MLPTRGILGRLEVVPDYAKAKEEVFEDLARLHIWYHRNLEVLLLCDLQS
jgi:hypothetical protein